MTTETTPGTDQSTGAADAGAGNTAITTILGAAGDQGSDAGKTADTGKTDDAGKTANDAGDGKTTDKDGDGKTDEGKKPEDDKAAGVPEKYEFSLPDGMEVDTALLEKADPVFRELGLTNEQAGKLAQLVAEQRISEGQALQDAYAKQMEDWASQTNSDKELGGSAEAVSANVQKYAFPFINQFGSPELKALLKDTGLGNHPEIVRTFIRAGKAMAEDGGVMGKSTSTKSAAAVLFDHPTSNQTR